MSNDELLDEITLLKAKILYIEGRIGALEMATSRLISHDDYDQRLKWIWIYMRKWSF